MKQISTTRAPIATEIQRSADRTAQAGEKVFSSSGADKQGKRHTKQVKNTGPKSKNVKKRLANSSIFAIFASPIGPKRMIRNEELPDFPGLEEGGMNARDQLQSSCVQCAGGFFIPVKTTF